ncbi:hypothetical protein SERLA73DRAFT_156122 [Serpula lacrymans var. lacrymans S7.3]|uniref:Uncharacterized protein n=1 Tax=Serpula lacrymans var. lacrymans (strain S7.3) TaxID=936435 RepID=F8QD17_SERL3|nr:hypothetical protein SERLA73DRAFT_156122 [Serpula lacrymans var. lacrymans S7.3]
MSSTDPDLPLGNCETFVGHDNTFELTRSKLSGREVDFGRRTRTGLMPVESRWPGLTTGGKWRTWRCSGESTLNLKVRTGAQYTDLLAVDPCRHLEVRLVKAPGSALKRLGHHILESDIENPLFTPTYTRLFKITQCNVSGATLTMSQTFTNLP